jgi:3-hydroxybutyryl-CoA dehydrogenase
VTARHETVPLPAMVRPLGSAGEPARVEPPPVEPPVAAQWLVDRYLARAWAMVEEGYACAADVDRAMRGACMLPRGPIETLLGTGLEDSRSAPLTAPASTGSATVSGPSRIGVAGSGTMATGVAEAFARAGRPVVLAARSRASGNRASDRLTGSIGRGLAPVSQKERTRGLVEVTIGAGALDGCELVIECVSEDPAVKRAVFGELEEACAERTVLATTTSSLSVRELAAATGRPERVVGMHFFNPAPVMPLVELIVAPRSSPEAVALVEAAVAVLGKEVVRCADRAGFIVNRLLVPLLNDALRAVADGCPAGALDDCVVASHGFPRGPVDLVDLIGTDIVLAIQQRLHDTFGDESLRPVPLLTDLVRDGVLGGKSGARVKDRTTRLLPQAGAPPPTGDVNDPDVNDPEESAS